MDSIDLGRAFKAPFADKDWPMKTLLGFVWILLVVTIPAACGAQIEYIRKVSRGDETLPEWSDFGEKWVQGFLVMVAGFIYFLPVAVLGLVFVVPAAVTAMADGSGRDLTGAVLGGGLCIFILLATLYTIAMSIFFYAAQVHFALQGNFGAFFDFGGIAAKVRGGTGYFTAWLYAFVISVALSMATGLVSSITGGIGGILSPAVSYLTLMMVGHILGQWAMHAYGVVAAPPAYAGTPGAYAPPAPPEYTHPVPPAYAPPAAPQPPAHVPPAQPAPVPPATPEPTPAPPEGDQPAETSWTEPPAPPAAP